MKTIGLIGGMSWESSLEYYKIINEEVRNRLGGFNSAKSVMYSVNFDEIEKLQKLGKWNEAGQILATAAKGLEMAGADCVVLCTNTMHIAAEDIVKATNIPFLHIADTTGEVINETGIHTVGLLGTKFTMQKDFYKKRLIEKYHLNVIIPSLEDQEIVHDIIYQELCMGLVQESSKQRYLKIISKLVKDGAEGIILGCTEIGLLVKKDDLNIPIFDTTIIHAESAVDFCLKDSN
jgi:aspartate racemase